MIRVYSKILSAITAVALLSTLQVATAQENEGYKIRVVDRARVFAEYDKQKKEIGALETTAQQREKELQVEIDKFEAWFKSQEDKINNGNLTNAEKLDIQETATQMQNEITNKREEWQRELDFKTERIMREIRIEINAAIESIGVKEGVDLILEADTDPRGGTAVLFYAPRMDMTEKVIEALNAEYKG